MGVPPAFVTVLRREPQTGMQYVGTNIHVRADLEYDPQAAPDPIRQSNFNDVGKAPGETWSRMPIALYMNIPSINAQSEDTFRSGKVRAQFLHLMRNGLGGQRPIGDRANTDRPIAAPFGNQTAVPGVALQPVGREVVTANGLTYRRR